MTGRQLADQGEGRAGVLELLLGAVQLDGVSLAVDSAVVAEPHEGGGALAPNVAETDVVAFVVRENDVGESCGAHLGRNLHHPPASPWTDRRPSPGRTVAHPLDG